MQIEILDLNFQGADKAIASFLVRAPQGPILIETGPASTWEQLKSALAARNLQPQDISHALVTHIHLDHAGALGWLAREGTQVYVHEKGAPHLVDPARLLSSAGRIYGDAMDRLWGETIPVPEDRMNAVAPGSRLQVAGLDIEAMDTPGHAGHHFVYAVEGVAFTGDAAGVRLAGSPFLDLPAPPPEFHRETWLRTLDRMIERNFDSLYLTHFGDVTDVTPHLHSFKELIIEASDSVLSHLDRGLERAEILQAYQRWYGERADAVHLSSRDRERYDQANPLPMSVDGIIRYWRKKKEAAM